MLIRVMRFQGQAPDIATQARFDKSGGTIGRSPQCTLSLADPQRHISRIQAEVAWSGEGFMLIDRGSAGHVQCNGEDAPPGQPVPLHDGDELRVGDYVLRVELPRPPSQGMGMSQPPDPFGDLIPPAPSPSAAKGDHPLAARSDNGAALIPADFDPFGKSCLAPGPGGLDDTLTNSPHQGTGGENSLDKLFGLGPQMDDPRDIGLPREQVPGQPNTASSDDPFEALQRRPAPSAPPVPDQAPEIHSPMPLPAARPAGAFRSWETPGGRSGSTIAGRPGIALQDRTTELNPLVAHPGAEAVPHPEEAAAPADKLLHALLSGAGLRELPQGFAGAPRGRRQLDEQTMHRIGELLRLFTQGIMDLLATRATLKSEMRSEMTMIAPEGNNPLKFSPDALGALTSLLAAQTPRGFMPPEVAVQDAMNDMIAHQVGVVAGMRAALQGLLERFQPSVLEKRLANRSMLDSVLPANRKAKLWEQFENTFNEVSKEAEDDFEKLFSREFVKAYEAQITALEQRGPSSKPRR